MTITEMRPALFLDRDGVINVDHGFVFRIADFQVIDGVFDALRMAQDRGYALIIVTNQSGIARGLFSPNDYQILEAHIRTLFAAHGIFFTAIYHCPHHPKGSVAEFTQCCDCRKPQPGMFLQAESEYGIDLVHSIMVGDKESDIIAARAAGISQVHLVQSPESSLSDVIF